MPSRLNAAFKSGHEGIFHCYSYMYKMFCCWGVVTFWLYDLKDGGPRSTFLSVVVAFTARFSYAIGFIGSLAYRIMDEEMAQAMLGFRSPVIKVIFIWECTACPLTYIEFCLLSDKHRRRHINLLCSMQILDKDVCLKFPHVNWQYDMLRKKYAYGSIVILSVYLLISLVFVFEMVNCSCGMYTATIISISYSTMTATVGLVGFMHMGIIDYLRLRYRLLIKLIHQQYAALTSVSDSDEKEQLELLQQNMDHLLAFSKRCSDLLVEINEIFGFIGAAGTFYDFAIMTCFTYAVLENIIQGETAISEYIFITILMVIHGYKVIVTCAYGYLLQREKRDCQHLLSIYGSRFAHLPNVRSITYNFQHWRMHNNHMASFGLSLRCNTFTIYVIFNGIANYVIVLVQLLFQQAQLRAYAKNNAMAKDVELIKPSVN